MGKIYAQIYSIIRQDREGVLKALKTISQIGYDGVELIGNNTGDLSITDFKKYLADLKLTVSSVHSLNCEKDYEFARELGARYAVTALPGHPGTREEVLAAAETLNEIGRSMARFDLKCVYHNHANEFIKIGNSRVYDILIENTDPSFVGFEFDIGWGQLAGADCPSYILKYAGRFPLLHVKECDRIAKNEEAFEHFPMKIVEYAKKLDPDFGKPGRPPKFPPEAAEMMYNSRKWNVALAEGLVDWKAIRDAAEVQGVEAYISEREYYHIGDNKKGDPTTAAVLDYQFLRKLVG